MLFGDGDSIAVLRTLCVSWEVLCDVWISFSVCHNFFLFCGLLFQENFAILFFVQWWGWWLLRHCICSITCYVDEVSHVVYCIVLKGFESAGRSLGWSIFYDWNVFCWFLRRCCWDRLWNGLVIGRGLEKKEMWVWINELCESWPVHIFYLHMYFCLWYNLHSSFGVWLL